MRQRKRKYKRSSKRKKVTKNPYSINKKMLWLSAFIALLIYAYIFYNYVVSPFTLPWKALYGKIEIPKGYTIKGIDISHHQGKINWEQLTNAKIGDGGINFIFIKATEGKNLLDENFNDNFYQAREYGFIRGAYHFFHPEATGKAQAEYYIKQVHLEEGDLPPILDIEKKGNLSKIEIQREALVWLRTVQLKYKTKPIIYTNRKFKENYLNSQEFDQYPYWIAHYYVPKMTYNGEWKFWQFTDLGQVSGIKGKVDCNIYNGSMYDLKKLTLQ